jgi:hypothetical protein
MCLSETDSEPQSTTQNLCCSYALAGKWGRDGVYGETGRA